MALLSRRAALLSLLLVCFAVAALAGCGDDEHPGSGTSSVGTSSGGISSTGTSNDGTSTRKPERLSAAEQSDVREAQVGIQSYCHELTLYLARRRGAPTGRETERAYAAVDRLAEIAADKPAAAQGAGGRTVRDLLGDIAEDLEGSNCASNVEQRIEKALAALPAR